MAEDENLWGGGGFEQEHQEVFCSSLNYEFSIEIKGHEEGCCL